MGGSGPADSVPCLTPLGNSTRPRVAAAEEGSRGFLVQRPPHTLPGTGWTDRIRRSVSLLVRRQKDAGPTMCTPDSALHSKTLLYPRETPPRPRWRESLAVIDYGEKLGQPLDDAAQHTNVVVAIPAFNEGPTIGSVVLKARQFGSEVLVVDDGSTDDTAWIAELAGATVIRHRRNLGYGAALRSCFLYARNSRSEMMVVLDGDGQHDPSAIPRVLDPVMTGDADVSIGSRFLETKTASAVPRYRRFGIGLLTKLTNLGTKHGTRLHDAQSGFRAYSRNAIDLLDPKDADMVASAEIIWDADRSGLRIVEVPIDVRYTGHG